jgi:hypothetical protein
VSIATGPPCHCIVAAPLLGWIKDDAQHIADQISKFATARVDTSDDQQPLMAKAQPRRP